MTQPQPTPSAEALPELKGLRVVQELGRSPKGVTYKARRLVEQDVVAVKLFRQSQCEKQFVVELPQKAEATFVLEHKGLVRSLGCVNEGGRLLLLMDYAHGEPLSRALRRGAPFPPSRALLVALQCANALAYAALHKLHHGRLHPGDVILGEDHARIVGVGLGERPEHAVWSAHDPYLFEPLIYTAPEAMPSKPSAQTPAAQAAVDIYSLGAILYHLATGVPPFGGTDEGTLDAERKALRGPVAWPADRKASLPPAVVALTEKMLAPAPEHRASYSAVSTALTQVLAAVEKAETLAPPAPVVEGALQPRAPAAASVEDSATRAPMETGLRGGIRPAVSATSTTGPVAPIYAGPPQAPRSRLASRLYATFLVGLTALVFIVAVGLAAKIFLFDALRQSAAVGTPTQPPAPQIQTPPAPPTAPVQPPPKPAPAPVVAVEPAARTEDYVTATRQVELIQELLAKKEIRPSAGVLKMLKTIADKAGRDTTTGVKAAVLAAEVEDALLAPERKPQAAAPQPAVADAEPKKPEAKTEGPAPVIPGVGRAGTPVADKPAPGTEPGAPPPPAKTGPVQTTERPVGGEGSGSGKIAAPLKALMQQAKAFQYTAAMDGLAKLAASSEGEEKSTVEAYAGVMRQEQEFFKRCRNRLVDDIQRRPRHDSPLQVFPRKNEPGDDIVDFDETGLKISEKRGAVTKQRTHPWERTPPAQACELLKLTLDRTNVDDQLGLAITAFNRGLKDEMNAALAAARALPGGTMRADALEKVLKQLAQIIESAPAAQP
ncbi:MAG: protein kinase [Planctomycetota bacterium]|nr:protein kinase [Planctomycetota bacterium]